MTAQTASRRRRLASPAAVVVAGGVVLLLLAAGWPLSAMAHQLNVSNDGPDILVLAAAAVGMVVAWQKKKTLKRTGSLPAEEKAEVAK